MKSGVITEKNTLLYKDSPMPILGPGEVMIKVSYCGICGSDIHVLKGEHPTAVFPVIPGHEFVGELVEISEGTFCNAKIGDLVVAQPFFSCRNCEPCAKGEDNVCEHLNFLGIHTNGGFAEYVKVKADKVYALPETVDSKLAALTEPIAVAVHDVRRSGLKVGEDALIIGGGPIGLLIAIVAKQAGANNVVISEISEYRRNEAQKLGFVTVNPLDEDFDKKIKELTKGKGFDVVFEVSGSKPGISTAVDYAKITGTVMIVGMTSEPYPIDLSQVFAKELRIQGVRIHSQYNFMGAIKLLENKELTESFGALISEVFPVEKIEDAFAYAQTPGEFFKILVKM